MFFLSCHKDDWRLNRDWVYYLTCWFKSQLREKATGRTEPNKRYKQEEGTTLFTQTRPFYLQEADRIKNNSNIIRESQYGCTNTPDVCNSGVWIRVFCVSVNYCIHSCHFFLFLTESHTGVFTTDISLTSVFDLSFSHWSIRNKCTRMLTVAGMCLSSSASCGWCVDKDLHRKVSVSSLPLVYLLNLSVCSLKPDSGILTWISDCFCFAVINIQQKNAVCICIPRMWQYYIKDAVRLFLMLDWCICMSHHFRLSCTNKVKLTSD